MVKIFFLLHCFDFLLKFSSCCLHTIVIDQELSGCRPCRKAISETLPKWVLKSNHRDSVLKAIDELQKKLDKTKQTS
jgi:predicted Fe-S protein YdhL (DUF1289 family)